MTAPIPISLYALYATLCYEVVIPSFDKICYALAFEDFYHQDQPHFTETTIEEVDPNTGAKTTRTIRTFSHTVVSPLLHMDHDKNILEQFITQEKNPE
ncbi:hypothetical protein HHI36_019558 [Cryptolaemus montrouzieri]|uniref:Uncharacterized protein n=1 Tax=Cryptolaemus montrouzieri TaxID=559131 RepID=A0ABD2N7T7_9CUCU